MMSKTRAERKIQLVKCPCCQLTVPESRIVEQSRDAISVRADDANEIAV
ncbi:hypothetical protein MYA_4205 [Burkholderia sp. KJ006]|nr:hypothetical protein MYA_4205 [Burkholderia sp. KJ006]